MRAIEAWQRWVSDDDPLSSPDAVRPSRAADVLRRHPTVADGLLAVAVAALCLPQLVYWSRESTGGFAVRLAFSVLMVAPLVWRRRFPLSTFAVAASVALVQWGTGVTLAADVALLIYLYTVASRYRVRVGVLAAAVVELGVVLAAASLLMDFEAIEVGVRGGAPESESWRGAFGLLVTMVWLYTTLLRILSFFRN